MSAAAFEAPPAFALSIACAAASSIDAVLLLFAIPNLVSVLAPVVSTVVAAAFALVFDLAWWRFVPGLAGIVALGSLGISSVGTLFSAMAVRTRFREVLLPVLLLPALFPVLAGAVRGTTGVLAGTGIGWDALQLLIVVDGIYWVASFLVFEYVLDE